MALAGFLLGGTVGIGTVVFMVAIGPLTQVFLPMMRMPEPTSRGEGNPEQTRR